ncbi:MAG: dTMP kinase [Vibrio sp.]
MQRTQTSTPGQFIVIEGLEGAGKSTAIATVKRMLENAGIKDIVQTREPGGTVLAEKMRALVKEDHAGEVLHDKSELMLIYAARIQLVENVIKPALAQGQFVIGDRHDMSSQAYQGAGRGIDQDVMASMKQLALGDFKPDLTLYLDIDPKLGLARARGRGELDRIEKMDISFFERAHQKYLQMAADDPSVQTIDASQDLATVTASIEQVMSAWLITFHASKA